MSVRTAVPAGRPGGQCLFRVAAGPRLGFGHLMRARSLARCLGVPTLFSIRGGPTARQVARDMRCEVVSGERLPGGVSLLVVDDPSLEHGRAWTRRARLMGVPTVSIHDVDEAADADLTVCGDPRLGACKPTRAMLRGSRFYLLDPAIARARRGPQKRADGALRVLIALGGGQHVKGVAGALVGALRQRREDLAISVAAGFTSGPRPGLCGARWISTRGGLARVLARTDVAIVAGGVTLFESCALGVPSVALAVVAGQRPAISTLAAQGAVLDAGEVFSSLRSVAHAADGVVHLLADAQARLSMRRRARRVVDGRGAHRVAARILQMLDGSATRG